jgi:hypothetical protein
LGFDYRTFFSERRPDIIAQVVPQTEGEVNQAQRRIREYVASLNVAIEGANKTFPARVHEIVDARQKAIRAKDHRLDTLSLTVGIPLRSLRYHSDRGPRAGEDRPYHPSHPEASGAASPRTRQVRGDHRPHGQPMPSALHWVCGSRKIRRLGVEGLSAGQLTRTAERVTLGAAAGRRRPGL